MTAQAFGEKSKHKDDFKKGSEVWLCYTGDRVWRLSKIVEIHDTVPEFEVVDYDGSTTIRVGVAQIKSTGKEPF